MIIKIYTILIPNNFNVMHSSMELVLNPQGRRLERKFNFKL